MYFLNTFGPSGTIQVSNYVCLLTQVTNYVWHFKPQWNLTFQYSSELFKWEDFWNHVVRACGPFGSFACSLPLSVCHHNCSCHDRNMSTGCCNSFFMEGYRFWGKGFFCRILLKRFHLFTLGWWAMNVSLVTAFWYTCYQKISKKVPWVQL